MTSKNLLLTTLLFYLFLASALGQTPVFKAYNLRNGLPTNEVYEIGQDKNGYIYCASERGLLKFNGGQFRYLHLKDSTFSIYPVFKVRTDSKGQQFLYLPYKGFYRQIDDTLYSPPENEQLKEFRPTSFINEFILDSLDRPWFRYPENPGELFLRKKNGTIDSISSAIPKQHLKDEFTISMYKVPGSPYLAATFSLPDSSNGPPSKGHFVKTEFGWKFYHMKRLSKGGYPSKNPLKALLSKHYLWLGYMNFVIRKDLKTGEEEIFKTEGRVNEICHMTEEKVIVSTMKGIYFFSKKSEFPEHLFKQCAVSSCFEDRENAIWLSTLNKGIIYIPSIHIRKLDIAEFSERVKWLCYKNSSLYALSANHKLAVIQPNKTQIFTWQDYPWLSRSFYNIFARDDCIYLGEVKFNPKDRSFKRISKYVFTRNQLIGDTLFLFSRNRGMYRVGQDSLQPFLNQKELLLSGVARRKHLLYLYSYLGVSLYNPLTGEIKKM